MVIRGRVLAPCRPVWQGSQRSRPYPIGRFSHPARRCRSSVVEHPLGKGEVVSSILTGSTRKSLVPSMFWQLPSKRLVAESCRTERDATGEIRTKSAPSVLYVYMATEPRMPHEQRVCAL